MSNNFKDNLRFLRLNSGLTQKQLAELLNVDQRTVSAWEKACPNPICKRSISFANYSRKITTVCFLNFVVKVRLLKRERRAFFMV